MTNCPNCGAPITEGTCEYCGTVFVDPYKEQMIQLEQELLRVKTDILNEQIIMTQTRLSQAAQTNDLLQKIRGWV